MMSNHIIYLLILIFFNLMFLDDSNYLVFGQLLDIEHQNSIILNDKLYFFGGQSYQNRQTISQIIYIDLPASFSSLDKQQLQTKKIDLNSVIHPFHKASLALAGTNNGTLYVIAGSRANTTNYGSMVYSINTTSFDTWTPEVLDGQSELIDLTDTIYTQDNYGNTYIASYKHNPIYNFNTNNLRFTTLKSDGAPDLDPYQFNCHLLGDETMIFFGLDMTTVYLFSIKQNLWSNVTTVGDKPSGRNGHSSVLVPDGRIVVYGGTNGPDKLAILDTRQSPFKWTIPKNITHPVDEYHVGHSSNLYNNFMIIAFGWIHADKSPYSNILLLNISDKNNYSWLDAFHYSAVDFTTEPTETLGADYSPPKHDNKGFIILLSTIAGAFVLALILLTIGIFTRKTEFHDNVSDVTERHLNFFGNAFIDCERYDNNKSSNKHIIWIE